VRRNLTASFIRSLNRSSILNYIRENGPVSRSQIARDLNISLPTVMRIVEDLIADRLVKTTGYSSSTGGRPSTLIEFNGEAYAVLGIDLGGTKMYGTVADLCGNIQHRLYVPHQAEGEADGDAYIEKLIDFIHQLLDAPRPPGQAIRGIGVGVPGITKVPDGVVVWAPALGWRDLHLQDILTEAFDVPVTVENDVNLTVLGEWGFGAGKGVNTLVSIAVGTGIGAGILIDGALYRGHALAAGEIGYMVPSVEYLGKRYEGFGALEILASGTGIAKRARALLQAQGATLPTKELNSRDVFAAARQGQSWAQQVVNETVDYLSLAIANISVVLNPEMVVIGGGVAGSADLLIAPIQRRLDGVIPSMPRIVASPLGRDAAVMGAIMQVMNATEEYFVAYQVF